MQQSRSWIGFLTGACLSAACVYLIDPLLAPKRRRRAEASRMPYASPRGADLAETIEVSAPSSAVFDFWTRLDAVPRVIEHVREVRVTNTGGRYHWSITGPVGLPVEFDAVLTQYDPHRVLAWKTAEGSPLAHTGVVLFEPVGEGTRVHAQFSYALRDGAPGRTIAALAGGNARAGLVKCLARMRAAVEAEVNCCDRVR
jgi:uncharacterized membrane protein